MTAEISEAWCYETFRRVRWPGGITCPFCSASRATTHSKSGGSPRRRYLCLTCRRTFTDLTATPLARTNLPLAKWFLYLRLLRHLGSTADLARALGVKWDTAVGLQRRVVLALARPGLLRQLRDAVERAGNG